MKTCLSSFLNWIETKQCFISFYFLYDRANSISQMPESQKHRIVGVGRDLCGSPSPALLPKQGHLQQAAQDLVQAGLEYLQRRRLNNLPGHPQNLERRVKEEKLTPGKGWETSTWGARSHKREVSKAEPPFFVSYALTGQDYS